MELKAIIYTTNHCRNTEELLLSGMDALALFREHPRYGRRHPSGRVRVRAGPELKRTSLAGPVQMNFSSGRAWVGLDRELASPGRASKSRPVQCATTNCDV